MRTASMLLAVAMMLLLDGRALEACGDKFFIVGRGERFSRAYATLHPGTILVYTHGTGAQGKGLGDDQLHRQLARAGHRVTVATNPTELASALRSGSVDIILTSLSRAVDLAAEVSSVPSTPTLVPVAVQGDPPPAAEARHELETRLKASDRPNRFLAEIEEAMKARAAAGLWRRAA